MIDFSSTYIASVTTILSLFTLRFVSKQVKFNNAVVIHGIATQGTWNDPNNPVDIYDQRVTKYEILYSLDGANWTTVTDDSGQNKV